MDVYNWREPFFLTTFNYIYQVFLQNKLCMVHITKIDELCSWQDRVEQREEGHGVQPQMEEGCTQTLPTATERASHSNHLA
jgi:hypothetical protein